ncbi:MAG: hypothetical protein K0Q97_2665, partial [Bacillota bacterium]|nr:hypothetical protein [Bacillota bacterium]
MKNLNLIINEDLEDFNFDILDCFQRPKCIISDNLVTNSWILFLLFSEYQTGFLKENYTNFILNNTGISLEFNCGEMDTFYNDLEKMMDENKIIILLTDLYYDINSPKFFNKIHHIHYSILEGYNKDEKYFIVIDEIPSVSEYNKIKYSKQKKQYNALKNLAIHMGDFKYENAFIEDNKYFYYSVNRIINIQEIKLL